MPHAIFLYALIMLCVMAFFILFISIIKIIETLMIWPYGPENRFGVPDWPNPMVRERVEQKRTELEASGFKKIGDFFDQKGKSYQSRYEFYRDELDGKYLFMIAHGKILGIPLSGELVFSSGMTDKSYLTTTNMALGKRDWKGRWMQNYMNPDSLAEILKNHDRFILKHGDEKSVIDQSDPMAFYRKRRIATVEELELERKIYFLDDDRNRYRYRLFGAVRTTIAGYFGGFATAFKLKYSP